MSAIAGILHFSESRRGEPEMGAMLDAMSHRYRSRGIESIGPVLMGYGAFPTTKEESPIDKPFLWGNRALVFDGRLDNRGELGKALDYESSRLGNTSDHEIIMASYDRWGTSCLSRLVGVFAFALWDGSRLFCARDRFGVKPFTYSRGKDCFSFASESKALLALHCNRHGIDEEQICLHFYPQLLTFGQERTHFKDIFRLPPAHGMVITTDGIDIFRYWELSPDKKTRYRDENEYYEHFRELLSLAVNDRLRSLNPVGTALSGGLDSSAISCLARDIYRREGKKPLETFSCVFREVPGSDESEWISAVENRGHISPNHVHPDRDPPMEDIEDLIWLFEGPYYGANSYLQKSLYRAARKKGVTVFLDGEDGDSIVSHGYDYLCHLACREDWSTFFDESDGMVRLFDNRDVFFSRSYLFKKYGLPYLKWLRDRGRWISLMRNTNSIHKKLDISRKKFIKALFAESEPEMPSCRGDEPLNREMWEKYRIGERLRNFHLLLDETQLFSDNWHHFNDIVNSGYAYSLEFADLLAAWYGVEVRHPFFDHRLAEFCVSLPSHIKLRNGYTRFYFRKAMDGILPEKVQWRGGKGDLAHSALRGYRYYHQEELIRNNENLLSDGNIVNHEYVKKIIQDYRDRKDDSVTLPLWTLSTYSLWKTKIKKKFDSSL